MKTTLPVLIFAGAALGLGACAHEPPAELASARDAYDRASHGPAAQYAPQQLGVAKNTLDLAESQFDVDPEAMRVKDLGYVAQRQVEMAEASAQAVLAKQQRLRAENEYMRYSRLTQHGTLKHEGENLVLTLSGSVLFAFDEATLLPEAKKRLDEVASALKSAAKEGRKAPAMIIEGYTDSTGSEAYNVGLSERRAEAVKDYFMQAGYKSDLIETQANGEANPIATNKTPEGRANNRRVEIMLKSKEK
jgi:outer membrane protein OmpA-like peptidoglycan-associated protein